MTAIVLEHVTKRYSKGMAAVRDLNLELAAGELVVLVGPSGCGKTTTLRLIAGLEEPTEGTIRIGGRVMNGQPPRERDVALVFQQAALYPHLSVRDNLGFGLSVRESPGQLARLFLRILEPRRYHEVRSRDAVRDQRVREVADLLGLTSLLERLPSQLSGGQQQRVALGRALVRQPGIFLFDEPLSNLDGPLRAEMRRQLHLLHRRLPATMVYVTHDPVEALSLADRVVVLKDGVVQQADTPLAVYDNPSNRFVAGFIGSPPMNFLEGQLTVREGRLGVAAENDFLPLSAPQSHPRGPYPDQPVVLGIRPEAVRLARGRTQDAHLRMRRVLVEPIGATTLAVFQRGSWQVTALIPRESAPEPEDAEFQVYLDMTRVHLFERESGAALSGVAAQTVRAWTADA